RRRLEVLLQAQKQLIHHDVQQLKAQLQPVTDAVDFIKKITTRDKTSLLLNIGSDIVINSVVKRVILSRAGWFVRTVIPYFLKNFFLLLPKIQELKRLLLALAGPNRHMRPSAP